MKKISELTEKQILNLTDDQIDLMIKFKQAEEGVKFLERPSIPEYFEIKKPESKAFSCELFGSILVFSDFGEITGLMEYLNKCTSKLRLVDSYDLKQKHVTKKLQNNSYSSDSWDQIKTHNVFPENIFNQEKEKLNENKKLKDSYDKDLKEWKEHYENSKWIKEEVNSKVSQVREKYYTLDNYCIEFKNNYLPIAENNEEIAMKFMNKAYSLTDDQKEYILKNYKK